VGEQPDREQLRTAFESVAERYDAARRSTPRPFSTTSWSWQTFRRAATSSRSAYSVNLALPAAQRDELFARIHARIAERGRVRKTYLATLNVARKS
jgi:hypothetical protein